MKVVKGSSKNATAAPHSESGKSQSIVASVKKKNRVHEDLGRICHFVFHVHSLVGRKIHHSCKVMQATLHYEKGKVL